jgi:hypothetical protein
VERKIRGKKQNNIQTLDAKHPSKNRNKKQNKINIKKIENEMTKPR